MKLEQIIESTFTHQVITSLNKHGFQCVDYLHNQIMLHYKSCYSKFKIRRTKITWINYT